MKLVKIAWVLGGMVSLGLGMLAEACASSNNSSSVGTGGCAALTTCCDQLSATQASQCTPYLSAGNDAKCAQFLASIETSGYCSGISTSGTGSSTAGNSSTQPGNSSTQPGNSSTQPGNSSTQPGNSSTTQPGNSSTTQPGSSSGTSASSGSCKDPHLHPGSGAGVYCPFSGVGDAGNTTCNAGEVCCEYYANDAGKYPPSKCVSSGSCGSGVGKSLACFESIDCGSGKYCCGNGTPTPEVGCSYDYVSKFSTVCSSSACASPQFTICEMASECPSAQPTCGLADTAGSQFGICQ